ncbi:MAG TPA: type II toxin-antitoxin system prevent-host-death family antitoxin [Verrucomicrobiae bacterium]|jgi:prevent-host-death family protein|nr:type II toxin-antitoxin system prevent-host-death family antitoxin [Verrucomicrobiae bacterium]
MMIEVSTTEAVNEFHRLLSRVERGETVRIRKHGRASARIVPDTDFMSGKAFANVFAGYKATAEDRAAADAIAAKIAELDAEFDHALAH